MCAAEEEEGEEEEEEEEEEEREEAFSQEEVASVMVEMLLVRIGASRERPAPAVPWEEKKVMPRRRRGRKPARAVREMEGRAAWMGRVVTVVLELVGRKNGGVRWLGGFFLMG